MRCFKCSQTVETFSCDACSKQFCSSCSNICPTEVRVLQLKCNRILKFICTGCTILTRDILTSSLQCMTTTLLKEIQILKQEIQHQDGKMNDQMLLINRLVHEIEDMKGQKQNGTYASVIRKNTETIVVKPKQKQESTETKNDLKEKIDPKNMAIAVENIKNGKEGTVIINCSNVNTMAKIKETVENELGSKYDVTEGKKKDPKIIIRGVEEEFIAGGNEEIIQALKSQNDLNFDDETTFSVLTKYKQRGSSNKGNIILLVDFKLKQKICLMGKLNIGWRRCVVHEYFSVLRCYKCARYGHMAANCVNNVTCFKCSESHKTSECRSSILKCSNCMEACNKFKKSLDINHSVTDINCPCYRRILSLEENKTKQA